MSYYRQIRISDRTVPDLAGHERYLKTTLYGLTSGAPSCVMLVIGANAGVIGMSKEHLAVALALSVPIVVCITKVRAQCSLSGLQGRCSWCPTGRYDATK
jgi:GTPase